MDPPPAIIIFGFVSFGSQVHQILYVFFFFLLLSSCFFCFLLSYFFFFFLLPLLLLLCSSSSSCLFFVFFFFFFIFSCFFFCFCFFFCKLTGQCCKPLANYIQNDEIANIQRALANLHGNQTLSLGLSGDLTSAEKCALPGHSSDRVMAMILRGLMPPWTSVVEKACNCFSG